MKKHTLPKPGDLVVLHNIGRSLCLTVWETWKDQGELTQDFWPKIVGTFRNNQTAIVLEIYNPIKGPIGARICTEENLVGWISAKHLSSIT